jgi:hypothetical protein
MNCFMNGLLEWHFDWEGIDDIEEETGVLWVHENTTRSESPVLEDQEDDGGYCSNSSEEIDKSGSRRSLNVERYR